MNKHLIVLLSAVMALLLACTACSQVPAAEKATATEEPVATEASAVTEAPAASQEPAYTPTGKVVIYNANSEDTTTVLTEMWNALYPDCEIQFITAGSG